MNWLLTLLMAILVPVVQPMVQTGVQRMQARMTPHQQQQQQPQPQIVFHEGRWWKYEGGQWYVWAPPAQERLAWNQQPSLSSTR